MTLFMSFVPSGQKRYSVDHDDLIGTGWFIGHTVGSIDVNLRAHAVTFDGHDVIRSRNSTGRLSADGSEVSDCIARCLAAEEVNLNLIIEGRVGTRICADCKDAEVGIVSEFASVSFKGAGRPGNSAVRARDLTTNFVFFKNVAV